MSLKQLNNAFVDLKKISYIGPLDRHIKHLGTTSAVIHYFLIVVDGHPIEIKNDSLEGLEKQRTKLIDDLTRIDGYLPG